MKYLRIIFILISKTINSEIISEVEIAGVAISFLIYYNLF